MDGAPSGANRDLFTSTQEMPHNAAAGPAAGGAVQGTDEFIQVDTMPPPGGAGKVGRREAHG